MFNFLLQITYPKFTKIGDKKVLQALVGYKTGFIPGFDSPKKSPQDTSSDLVTLHAHALK